MVLASPNLMTLGHVFFRENTYPVVHCWRHHGLGQSKPDDSDTCILTENTCSVIHFWHHCGLGQSKPNNCPEMRVLLPVTPKSINEFVEMAHYSRLFKDCVSSHLNKYSPLDLIWSILHECGLVWIPPNSLKTLHKIVYEMVEGLWR